MAPRGWTFAKSVFPTHAQARGGSSDRRVARGTSPVAELQWVVEKPGSRSAPARRREEWRGVRGPSAFVPDTGRTLVVLAQMESPSTPEVRLELKHQGVFFFLWSLSETSMTSHLWTKQVAALVCLSTKRLIVCNILIKSKTKLDAPLTLSQSSRTD